MREPIESAACEKPCPEGGEGFRLQAARESWGLLSHRLSAGCQKNVEFGTVKGAGLGVQFTLVQSSSPG